MAAVVATSSRAATFMANLLLFLGEAAVATSFLGEAVVAYSFLLAADVATSSLGEAVMASSSLVAADVATSCLVAKRIGQNNGDISAGVHVRWRVLRPA